MSERDGFADTLLDWQEHIPAQYTLRLARAVPIGGTVLDPAGNPVAGAEVGFNNSPDISLQTRPQPDDFGWPFWITANSDSQGHWEIDRIGKEALKTIFGGATHPDFVGSAFIFLARNPETATQLLAQTYVFKLGHAVTVRGIVKDSEGKPIPHANVLVGKLDMTGSRKGKSGVDGTFSIAGCNPGTTVITAQAKGFAAATLNVNLTDSSSPFELILPHGNVLKLRVVDKDGNPVPHANVLLNTFQNDLARSKETCSATGRIQSVH